MWRLRGLSNGMLEAGWLAAVILVPLFIDKNRTEVFDPAKAGVLRALALWMLTGWAIRALSTPPAPAAAEQERVGALALARRLMRVPMVLPAGLVLFTTLLSTALSLAPRESLWGHYGRGQGAVTTLASLTIFAATAANLRTGAQLQRLVTALLLPSLPIALYAIFQRLHLEPMQVTFRQTELQRATSLLGQPVFLAAYMGMIIPFTVMRGVQSAGDVSVPRLRRALSASLYVSLFALQLASLLFTESRGPLLSLTLAAVVGLLAVAAQRGARRTVLYAGGVAGASALLLALATPIVLYEAPAGSERARIAHRVAGLFDARGGGGLFRAVNWTVAERVVTSDGPLERADGTHDEHRGLRTLVGFGPELQYAVATPFYPPELPEQFTYFLMDRFHHDLWDALVTTGVLGLLAVLATQTAALFAVVRGLGLLATARRRRLYWTAYGGGGALGALLWTLWQGSPFVFLGLQIGAVLGVGALLAGLAMLRTASAVQPLNTGMLAALLTALVSHALETSFSFTVVTTGALFWMLCALLVACTRACAHHDDRLALAQEAEAPLASTWTSGLTLGLTLMALGWGFLGGFSLSSKPSKVLWEALTLLSSPPWKQFPAVAIIVAATLLVGTLMLALEPAPPRALREVRVGLLRAAGGIGALAAAVGVGYWVRLAYLLAQRGVRASSNAAIVGRNVALRSEALTSFYACCLLILLLYALASALRARPPAETLRVPWAWGRTLAAAGLAAAALALVPFAALQPAVADAAVAVGRTLDNNDQMPLAEEAYRRAAELEPRSDRYMASLGKAYAKHARLDGGRAEALYQLGNQALLEAIARNPAVGEHATNLAIVRGQWALAADGEVRDSLRRTVSPLYQRALRLNPQDPTLWRRWAQAQLSLFENPLSALTSAQRALALDPKSAASYALLAECQSVLARGQEGAARREGFLTAASSYRRAINLAPKVPEYRVGEGKALLEAGDASRAVAALRTALAVTPATAPLRKTTAAALRKAESALALLTTREKTEL